MLLEVLDQNEFVATVKWSIARLSITRVSQVPFKWLLIREILTCRTRAVALEVASGLLATAAQFMVQHHSNHYFIQMVGMCCSILHKLIPHCASETLVSQCLLNLS
jgi:hypothetical protein